MKFLAIIFLTMVSLSSMAHEGHQAFYKIAEENGKIILTVKVEIPDLSTCLESEGFCSTSQDLNWCASAWVSGLFSIRVDGKTMDEQFESSFNEMGHLVLRYTLSEVPEKFESLEVTNFCFLGSFDSYENILQVSLNGHNQGYKMSANRTSIKIDFSNRS